MTIRDYLSRKNARDPLLEDLGRGFQGESRLWIMMAFVLLSVVVIGML